MNNVASEMLNVVCIKVRPAYNSDYVNRLYRAIETNLSIPHKFICITDDPAGIWPEIDILPVIHASIVGWWQKIALFEPPRGVQGRMLYFDLDTVITGCIDDFAMYNGEFAAIRPFLRQGGINSGLMSIAPGFGNQIWTSFASDPASALSRCTPIDTEIPRLACGFDYATGKHTLGDQHWIGMHASSLDYWQDICPEQLVSFNLHCRKVGQVPPGARIVAFHGYPRPHEAPDWMRKYWK